MMWLSAPSAPQTTIKRSFQQAVIRNVNEKNAQLQKELGNVTIQANGELSILNNKVSELERELELERRKALSLEDSLKEREKEYQKLKSQFDRIKRRALLNPNALAQEGASVASSDHRLRPANGTAPMAPLVDVGAVVNNMDASGVFTPPKIQRTPITNRTVPQGPAWRPMNMGTTQPRLHAQRQPFNAMQDRSFRSTSTADSMNEVENLLGGQAQAPHPVRRAPGWQNQGRPNRAFAPNVNKRPNGGFRPAGMIG
ncbi:hypothetical protein NM688_g7461 [Phlebia brevispora]|uniref:Uncharacterized protein n=1 Tax=Phlebia brevispora TaxID=194682 RepID=A0ACC1S505_9APHY|nr:hypothetical protein NM688_g7461 [Phlebia brevispora]